MDICFGFVATPSEPVGVKAFSLTVLGNLAKQYPEIISEIKVLIDEQLPHESIAFRSRAQKLLKSWK